MTQPDIFDDDAPWVEWLPELRVLLRAYNAVPRDERFVDTDDDPSPAMRSYLRIATYFPGRAARAAEDVLDVLRRGLDHPDVQRELPTMCPVTPPPGRTVEECLAALVPHLVAFTNAGEHAEPEPPRTCWEWRERLPNLSAMFLGYYHQDTEGTEQDTLLAYTGHEPPHEVAAAARELADLRRLCGDDEDALTGAVLALGSDQLPVRGQPCGDWLDDIGMRLTLHVDDPRPPAAGPDPAYPLHDVRATNHLREPGTGGGTARQR